MKTQAAKIQNLARGLTAIAVALGTFYVAQPTFGGTQPAPANSSAFGNDFTTWQQTWFRWVYGDITVPTDSNGNAVVGHHVVLFPLPDAPGDGTPGHLDVTLSTGQAFVLPLWSLLGTSYTDGTPPDPFVPDSVFQTLDISFTIDGVTVVDGFNAMNYYAKDAFTPAIPISGFPPVDSVIWSQNIGITHGPLTPGTHTFVLHAKNTEPAFGSIIEYNNTWTVTVQ